MDYIIILVILAAHDLSRMLNVVSSHKKKGGEIRKSVPEGTKY